MWNTSLTINTLEMGRIFRILADRANREDRGNREDDAMGTKIGRKWKRLLAKREWPGCAD